METDPAFNLTPGTLQTKINELGPWFHNLSLNGIETAPSHFLGNFPAVKWQSFGHVLPTSLKGKTVLDVGCNAGYYSFEMKRRGADRVVAIDHDEHYLRQAKFAAGMLGLDVSFQQLSVYEVGALQEQFDLVFFMGVFYHLRHPLLALDLLRRYAVRDTMVFQSLQRGSRTVSVVAEDYPFDELAIFDQPGYPKMHFVEKRYSADPTNWWIPNRAAVAALLRDAGFIIQSTPEEETFICVVNEQASLHSLPYSGF